jgi:hypothetical protein
MLEKQRETGTLFKGHIRLVAGAEVHDAVPATWREQIAKASRLDAAIRASLKRLGYGIPK